MVAHSEKKMARSVVMGPWGWRWCWASWAAAREVAKRVGESLDLGFVKQRRVPEGVVW